MCISFDSPEFHTLSRALAVNMQISKAQKVENMVSMLNMQPDLKGTISYQRLPHGLINSLPQRKSENKSVFVREMLNCTSKTPNPTYECALEYYEMVNEMPPRIVGEFLKRNLLFLPGNIFLNVLEFCFKMVLDGGI